MTVPVRTCVACRARAGQPELLRFVKLPSGQIAPDPAGHLPGRGAYLHSVPECLEVARKRRSLERVLGGSLTEGWVESVVRT